MHRYIPATLRDQESMLAEIGAKSIEDLFSDIPEEVRFKRSLNLQAPMSELEVTKAISALASKNSSLDEYCCFLGAGAYDHYIPSIIKHITSRSEFYTAYTPYQPEISQGTLQAIFEYQSMICRLTDLDVSNASVYDGATACAEAAIMAVEHSKRNSIIVSKSVHPETRRVLKTYMRFADIQVVEIDISDGVTDIDKLKSCVDSSTAGVIIQTPNFFGIIEDLTEVEKVTHQNKSLLIMSVDPISLGILKSPGEIGADIAVGEGQALGNNLSFGGPYLGFMAATSKLMRKMPGRMVGETVDVDGKRAFVLTLQAREQHIRREKALSNICSNQALNALSAAIYMTTLGKKGIREVAEQCAKKAHYAMNLITSANSGLKLLFNKPFFKEFTVCTSIDATKINQELFKNKILGGYILENDYPLLKNALLLCVTEKRTKEEIDYLSKTLEGIK